MRLKVLTEEKELLKLFKMLDDFPYRFRIKLPMDKRWEIFLTLYDGAANDGQVVLISRFREDPKLMEKFYTKFRKTVSMIERSILSSTSFESFKGKVSAVVRVEPITGVFSDAIRYPDFDYNYNDALYYQKSPFIEELSDDAVRKLIEREIRNRELEFANELADMEMEC